MTRWDLAYVALTLIVVGCSRDEVTPRTERDDARSPDEEPDDDGEDSVRGEPLAPSDTCAAVRREVESRRQPADIIFGVDTTGSMFEEIAATERNLGRFAARIAAAGIDTRVIVIGGTKGGGTSLIHVDGPCIAAPFGSGRCPDDSNPPGYVHVPRALSDWDILQGYVDLYPMYRAHLREDAVKTFVSISDGDIAANLANQQQINTSDEFVEAIARLEPDGRSWDAWRYSAIFAHSSCALGNVRGEVHAQLVERTGGVAGDLCREDFDGVFDQLAQEVVVEASLGCAWDIPETPSGQDFDPARTNVELTLDGVPTRLGRAASEQACGTRDGWHYDRADAARRVIACPETCRRIRSARAARVEVSFGCATLVI